MTKTTRVRATDIRSLSTWADVDASLKEIGLLDLEVEGLEAEYNRKIVALKEELAEKTRPLLDRKELLSRQIQEFVDGHRDELGKRKSRELNFGTVGFRQSSSVILRNVKAILQALKSRGMHDCIAVKESVNKEVLRQYPDDVLEAVGAKRKVEDVFWFEVKRDAIKPV